MGYKYMFHFLPILSAERIGTAGAAGTASHDFLESGTMIFLNREPGPF